MSFDTSPFALPEELLTAIEDMWLEVGYVTDLVLDMGQLAESCDMRVQAPRIDS